MGDRERRPFQAVIPTSAARSGTPPPPRSTRRRAWQDLADALERHLAATKTATPAWVGWAVRLTAGASPIPPAPDGSDWFVRTIVDFE